MISLYLVASQVLADGYVGFLDAIFVGLLPGCGDFSLNSNEIKMGLNDVTLTSRLRVTNPGIKLNAIEELTFKDRFSSSIK